MREDSSSSSISLVTSTEPFYSSLKLAGDITGTQVAYQHIYTASSYKQNLYASYQGATTSQQIFVVSGFAKATSVMSNPDSTFALAIEVVYHPNSGGDVPSEKQYFSFCKDTSDWQYVSGTFVIPANRMVEEIILSCEYSHNSGTAYFDNISVVYDPEGTSQYIYDENGRTKVSITGNDVIYYSYNTSGKLKDKITRKGRVLYDYNTTGDLKSEKYYTYSGQLLYLADYAPLILALGTHTLEMESSYQYNDYGLLTQSKVKSPQEDEEFITQTTYNVDAGSRIFGSIKTTIDSLSETVMYFYDETNGRFLANIQPDGNGTCYSYDAIGNLTMVQPSVYSSNEWIALSNSISVEYSYNSLNQLESISANGTEYNFTYDVFGNKTSAAVGGTSIVSQTYNPGNGKINSVTYSNGTVIS